MKKERKEKNIIKYMTTYNIGTHTLKTGIQVHTISFKVSLYNNAKTHFNDDIYF